MYILTYPQINTMEYYMVVKIYYNDYLINGKKKTSTSQNTYTMIPYMQFLKGKNGTLLKEIFFNKSKKTCENDYHTLRISQDSTLLEAKRRKAARSHPRCSTGANNVLFLSLGHEKIEVFFSLQTVLISLKMFSL